MTLTRDQQIDRNFKKLKKLRANSNKSDDEIRRLAEEQTLSEHLDSFVAFLDDPKEQRLAKKLVSQYLADYTVDTISDKNALQQLVYLEVVQVRMQDEINRFHKEHGGMTNLKMIEALRENLQAIAELKEALGLCSKPEDQNDAVRAFDLLKQKFKQWAANNQASRSLQCPHCSKMILLVIRTEAWKAQQHPFFTDKILFNEHLVRLYVEKKVTREDVAKILGTSPDYTDWLVEKVWLTNPKYKALQDSAELSTGKEANVQEEARPQAEEVTDTTP